MSYLSCTDTINACPTCPSGQSCQQIARSSTACAKNVCLDDGTSSSSSKSGGGGSSVGATAGGAVGGVLGVAAVLAGLYFFWWRPKGLAASQRRYSKHLSHRQSRLDGKRKSQLDGGAAGGAAAGENGVKKRSSVHLHVGEAAAEGAVNRRNTSPSNGRADVPTGVLVSRTSEEDNPFGDQNRSSIGTFNDGGSIHTSEYSFRSSQTNIIPIAYIPPHSSSVSVADGHRGAYGEPGGTSAAPASRTQAIRASIPSSMASRDSLALAGAELIELNPLPPVLTADMPTVPHGTMANGAPIRPPRSPGLDLQLPKTAPTISSTLSSPSTQRNSTSRPVSGFPFSSAPSSGSSPAFLTPSSSPTGSRGMSILAERPDGARSANSHLSTFTTRSGNSTMSYILDPPQIITPVNANGIRRVEFQEGQAAVVKIRSPANGSNAASPTSPASNNPFDDTAAEGKRHSRLDSSETLKSTVVGLRPTSSATDTSRWTTSSFASEGSEAVQFLQGQSVTFTNPNTPVPTSRSANTASFMSAFDVPQSARSSEAFDTGTQVRPLTGQSFAPNMSRSSTASGMSDGSHMSLLEGIPFMAPPLPGAATSSVSLGLPVNVTATIDHSPASVAASVFPTPTSAPLQHPASSSSQEQEGEDEDDPLPAPFLPFAGQRPTSSAGATTGSPSSSAPPTSSAKGDRVMSEAFSVRTGFGSGLSQIPFQLGFPSGFGEGDDGASEMGDHDDDDGRSDRGSMISTASRDSRFPPSVSSRPPSSAMAADGSSYGSAAEGGGGGANRDSIVSDMGEVVVMEATKTAVASSPLARQGSLVRKPSARSANTTLTPSLSPSVAPSTAPTTPSPAPPAVVSSPPTKPAEDSSNPFADPRASTDSFALAMALSASLDSEA